MTIKKTDISKVHDDRQKGEFITSGPSEPALPETVKREGQKGIPSPGKDAKADLRKAISEAARHDAGKSKSLTIKKAKQARRDVIVKTIMKHNRQAH
ncbi:hypothetical protein C6499_00740 [Candidatus Poribacteria bacterium]|nr:MAG: hypothetical protein C6499_00740 [Candidatus Poribacteria bacterium]